MIDRNTSRSNSDSKRCWLSSVVCRDGAIACDPGQDDPGIVGPCDDGFYWVTFFGALLPNAKDGIVVDA